MTADATSEPISPDAPRTAIGGLGVDELGRRAGHLAWWSRTLFELTGTWASESGDSPARLLWAAHCHQFAWHADLWRERLPVRWDHPPELDVVPGIAGMDDLLELLRDIEVEGRPVGHVERLVAVTRGLVPRLLLATRQIGSAADPMLDAPTVRTAKLVAADLIEQWAEGESLVQRLLVEPDDARLAGDFLGRVEAVLAGTSW
ncbi:MAG: hypothetical protein R2715_15575 [Ilumatobacteraceae bacterium]